MVTEAGFAAMAASVRRLAADLEVPVGLVLEGGYDLAALAGSLAVTLETLARDPGGAPAPEPAPPHPLADEAARLLAAQRRLTRGAQFGAAVVVVVVAVVVVVGARRRRRRARWSSS